MISETVTNEMGKPIGQARAEIDKSIAHVNYYIKNAADFMKDEEVAMKNGFAKIRMQPLGPTLVILPWNFPVWLTFKSCLAPLLLGNQIILKHSPSTPQSAILMESVFRQAGFD